MVKLCAEKNVPESSWVETRSLSTVPKQRTFFLITHIEFVKIRKGLYVSPEDGYRMLPFDSLVPLARKVQVEQ